MNNNLFDLNITTPTVSTSSNKKLPLPSPVTMGAKGKFISYSISDDGNYATFIFDVEGIEMKKTIYAPTLKEGATEEDKTKLVAQLNRLIDDLKNLAKYLGSEYSEGKVSSFKELIDLLFSTAKAGEELRLKIVYKDKVVKVPFDKAEGKSMDDLKAKYTPYTVISKNSLYWFKWKDSSAEFKIDETREFIDYEVLVEEPVLPTPADDLPFGTAASVDEDLF